MSLQRAPHWHVHSVLLSVSQPPGHEEHLGVLGEALEKLGRLNADEEAVDGGSSTGLALAAAASLAALAAGCCCCSMSCAICCARPNTIPRGLELLLPRKES